MTRIVPRRSTLALAFVFAGIAAAGITLTGCKGKDTSAPTDFSGADIDDLERMLAANERELAQVGVSIEPPRPAGGDSGSLGADKSARDDASLAQPPAAPEPEMETADEDVESAPVSQSRPDRAEEKQARRLQAQRCTTICDLASSTCGLEQQICRLAHDHQEDPRYRDSCERAELDCEVSAEACRACS